LDKVGTMLRNLKVAEGDESQSKTIKLDILLICMQKELNERIVMNPAIMTGKPIIRGTRIPVDMVVRLIATGYDLTRNSRRLSTTNKG